jgi:BolA family transcriptional regulator, general stress-responsive regulator
MSKLTTIETTLQAELQPAYLQVLDESHMHSRGQETHYKAVIVSDQFDGLNAVKRHQRAYAAMGDLMQQIHALALHTYTPQEWAETGVAPDSPVCAGGHK